MIIMIIGNFFIAYALPRDIFAWSHIPGKSQNNDFMQIYSTSFFFNGLLCVYPYCCYYLGRQNLEAYFYQLGVSFCQLFFAAFITLKMGNL